MAGDVCTIVYVLCVWLCQLLQRGELRPLRWGASPYAAARCAVNEGTATTDTTPERSVPTPGDSPDKLTHHIEGVREHTPARGGAVCARGGTTSFSTSSMFLSILSLSICLQRARALFIRPT
jgi:hypothetical protein